MLYHYGAIIQNTHFIDCKFTKTKSKGKDFLEGLRQLIMLKTRNAFSSYPSIWWKYKTWESVYDDYMNDLLNETQKEIMMLVVGKLGNLNTYLKLQEIIENNDKKKPKFEIYTVHAKKGYESDVVILANDFLNIRPTSNRFEEYCVFNTAITRAKKVLYLHTDYEYIRWYQHCANRIGNAWYNYKKWKNEVTFVLHHKLPVELCDHIIKSLV